MTTCRECGHEVPAGAAFCEVCGVPVVIACPACGSQQPGAARFCSKCGAAIPQEAPAETHTGAPGYPATAFPDGVSPASSPRRGIAWWIAIVVVVVAIVAAAAVYLVSRNPGSATVDGQSAAAGQPVSNGAGWVTQWSATDFNLLDVSFADAQRGWAVGGSTNGDTSVGVILATDDGGATWTLQDAGGGFGTLSAVWAIDERTCFAVGADWIDSDWYSYILSTHDGGASWAVEDAEHLLYDVTFEDASHGWCTGEYVSAAGQPSALILATEDGGRTWDQHLHAGVGGAREASFVSGDLGWITTDTPRGEPDPSTVRVYRTRDGGASLEKLFEINGVFSDICFVDDLHGWLAGAEIPGVGPPTAIGVWSSDDGGETWTMHETGGAESLYGVTFIDDLHGWAVGNGIWCTSDGGATWQQQLRTGELYLWGVAFEDALQGVACGDGGTVLATNDGGAGDGGIQSMDDTVAADPSAEKDEMRAFLRRIQELIGEAARGREKLRHAVYGFGGGSVSGYKAASEMEEVIANRESVLNQLRGISVPDDGRARRVRTTLMASMQASIDADEHYLAWMEGRGSSASAAPHDRAAGKAKARFVRRYNALAARYGMRSDWEVEDL